MDDSDDGRCCHRDVEGGRVQMTDADVECSVVGLSLVPTRPDDKAETVDGRHSGADLMAQQREFDGSVSMAWVMWQRCAPK